MKVILDALDNLWGLVVHESEEEYYIDDYQLVKDTLTKLDNAMKKHEIKSLKELEEILDDYDEMALAVVQMGLELTKDKRL